MTCGRRGLGLGRGLERGRGRGRERGGALLAAAALSLVTALGLLVAPAQAYVVRGEWFANASVGGVELCSLPQVKFREQEFSALVSVGVQAPRRLHTPMLGPLFNASEAWAPLAHSPSIAFLGESLFFIDRCQSWSGSVCVREGEARVFVLHMAEMAASLFATPSEQGSALCASVGPVPAGAAEPCFLYGMYQLPFPEVRQLVTFDSNNPSQLSVSPQRWAAWVDQRWGGSGGGTVLRVFDVQKRFMLSEDLLNSGELLEDFVSKTAVTDEDVVRENPTFCGEGYLLYVARRGNVSAIVLRSMADAGLAPETVGLDARFPVAGLMQEQPDAGSGSGSGSGSGGTQSCTAAWVAGPDATSPWKQYLTVLRMPQRVSSNVYNDSWASNAGEELFDLTIAGSYLAVVVESRADGRYRIRAASLDALELFWDVPGTESSTALRFRSHRDSGSTMLYTKRGASDASDDELHVLRLETVFTAKEDEQTQTQTHCLAEARALRGEEGDVGQQAASKRVLDAVLFKDLIVWTSAYASASGAAVNNVQVLEMLDLDKDNDGSIDAEDAFPFNFAFTADLDNDGYADEIDFIYSPGVNDDWVMYEYWVVFIVVFIMLTSCIVAYRRYLSTMALMFNETGGLSALDADGKYASTGSADALSPESPLEHMESSSVSTLSAFGAGTSSFVAYPGSQHGVKGSKAAWLLACARAAHMRLVRRVLGRTYSHRLSSVDRMMTVYAWTLTLLTVASIVMAVYPSFPYGGVSLRVLRVCMWVDFFSTSLFALDLFTRCVGRNLKESPTVRQFMLENWTDVPALITDVPLTTVRFPTIWGAFKLFRLLRLYRRFTQEPFFVQIMVKQPMSFLAFMVSLIVLTCAVFLKIFEQDSNPPFRDYYTVLWFTVVTVATVGYGDIKPINPESWVLTAFLMVLGIGLISTLASFCAEMMLNAGKTGEYKREMKEELTKRKAMIHAGLMHVAEPYNPLAVVLGAALESDLAQRRNPLAAAMMRRLLRERVLASSEKYASSALNVTTGMRSEQLLPIEQIVGGAGGKFRVNAISSQADIIRAVSKEYDQGMLLQVLRLHKAQQAALGHAAGEESLKVASYSSRSAYHPHHAHKSRHDSDLTPKTRLNFILLRFSLHRPERGGVYNFLEFADELADVMFEPPRELGNYLEKIFAIERSWNNALVAAGVHGAKGFDARARWSKVPQFYEYDFRDPVHSVFARIDDHMDRYGMTERDDYNELMAELMVLQLLYDRVQTVNWALTHLEYRDETRMARSPVLEEQAPPRANMPAADTVLVDGVVMVSIEHGL